jgi:hypothetical protein
MKGCKVVKEITLDELYDLMYNKEGNMTKDYFDDDVMTFL